MATTTPSPFSGHPVTLICGLTYVASKKILLLNVYGKQVYHLTLN